MPLPRAAFVEARGVLAEHLQPRHTVPRRSDYIFAPSEAALRRVATYFDTEEKRRRPGGQVKVTGADME